MSENKPCDDLAARVELSQLWTGSYPLVHAYICSSIRDFHRSEDVLQEVAAAAAQRFDDYDRTRPFNAWILGIARNKILAHIRKRSNDRHVFDEETVRELTSAYLRKAAELPLRHQGLEKCVGQLNARARKVLELRYVRDEKPAAIAKSSGMTPNAVSILLHRIRAALRECIESQIQRPRSSETEGSGAQVSHGS